jgi:uncharacterized protein YihD (DUF1040 family)
MKKNENKWAVNQIQTLFKSSGWQYVTLLLFTLFSFYLFLFGKKLAYGLELKKEVLDFVVRFMIFELPASITIFSFVYKEQKDASYSNTKTSRIWTVFIWTVTFSLITLLFSIITISKNPLASPDLIENERQFILSVTYAVISLLLLILFIFFLIRNMDIRNSFNTTFYSTKKYHLLLKNIFDQSKKYHLISYKHLLDKYSHLIESNFQLITSSMERNNLSEIQKELKKIYSLSQDFYQHFINVESIQKLTGFLSQNNNNFILSIRKNDKTFNNKDHISEIYNNILLNYKMLIRKSSNLGMTKIQKQAFTEFTYLNPVKLITHKFEDLSKEDFDNILEYYQILTDDYHRALFEILKEFSNENTFEYSYLLEKIADSSGFFEELTSISDENSDRLKTLHHSFVTKILTLIEAIIISSISANNIKFLTESTNILLRFYYTHVPLPNYQAEGLRKKIRGKGQEDFLDKFILQNKDLSKEATSKPYFKAFIVNEILRIIIHSLHKSIELGHYQCTGYLTKVCSSHVKINNFMDSILQYTNKVIDRNDISYDLGYFHYAINNFSKYHCIQKLVLIVSYQMIYKHGNSNLDLLRHTIEKVFLNEEELKYMIKKVKEAEDSYGMLAIKNIDLEQYVAYSPV